MYTTLWPGPVPWLFSLLLYLRLPSGADLIHKFHDVVATPNVLSVCCTSRQQIVGNRTWAVLGGAWLTSSPGRPSAKQHPTPSSSAALEMLASVNSPSMRHRWCHAQACLLSLCVQGALVDEFLLSLCVQGAHVGEFLLSSCAQGVHVDEFVMSLCAQGAHVDEFLLSLYVQGGLTDACCLYVCREVFKRVSAVFVCLVPLWKSAFCLLCA